EDCGQVFVQGWSRYQQEPLAYPKSDNWEGMLREGLLLLQQLVKDGRIRIQDPRHSLQVKSLRRLPPHDDFVAYIDAIGRLDGIRCLMDWKTTGSRYPEGVGNFLSLDPQLVCYSWVTGIRDVALILFVRKRIPEIQYLQTTITDSQRCEFGELVAHAIRQIESGHFLPHSGIRFPQNACLSCPYLGLCAHNQQLIDARLLPRTGAEGRDWLDQLAY